MMINNIFALFLVGVLGNIFIMKRAKTLVSFFLCVLLGITSYVLIHTYLLGQDTKFSLIWLKYLNLEVNIDLYLNKTLYQILIPIFILSVCASFFSIFQKDEGGQRFVSFIFLNLCFYIILLSSKNMVQLLVASNLISVIGFCQINDVDARKKYAFYNFLSDITLFSICSLCYAYLNTLDINAVELYQKTGAHKDLVVILFIFAISIKSGLLMFHNQFYDMSVLQFNRLNYLLYCGTPTAGMIILYKLIGILNLSDYGLISIKLLALGTFLSGLYNAFLKDNLKEKAVGIAQLNWGMGFYLISVSPNNMGQILGAGIFLSYLLNLMAYSVYNISSYEQNISKMGGFIKKLKFSFALYFISFICGINLFWSNLSPISSVICFIYILVLSLFLGYAFHQIFLGVTQADERVYALLKNNNWSVYLIMILFCLIAFRYINIDKEALPINIISFLVFLISFIFYPLRNLAHFYQNEQIQETDIYADIFEYIVLAPLIILGRILWLLVDFILIERTIINTLNNLFSKFLILLQKANHFSLRTSFAYLALGFLLLMLWQYIRK